MNKYLLRGFLLALCGAALIYYSLILQENENYVYKTLMSAGVILFGIGVVMSIYGIFRKIDRRTLQKHRRERNND